MTNLPHVNFLRHVDPSEPKFYIEIDLTPDRSAQGQKAYSGLQSLLVSAAGVAAINGLVGYLNGAATTMADLLTRNNIAADGGSVAEVFAACFVANAVVADIGERWVRYRRNKFMDNAASSNSIEAILDHAKGVWVVTHDGSNLPHNKPASSAKAKRKSAVLSDAEFRQFEHRVAEAGGTLKTHRFATESKQETIVVKVGGKLQSVDGEPAIQIWEAGKLTKAQWFENGRRVSTPGVGQSNERRYGELLRDWKEKQDPSARTEIIRIARDDLRQAAAQIKRDDILEDEDRKMVKYAQNLVLCADSSLREAFGLFKPLGCLSLDISNLDGMIEWPKETAESHRQITVDYLSNTIAALDAEMVALNPPQETSVEEASGPGALSC